MSSAAVARLRPEAELLLCCARTRMDTTRAGRIKALLRDGIDWDYLLRAAWDHGMMSLLYEHIIGVDSQAVPAAALQRLRERVRVDVGSNLFQTGELRKILDAFESQRIPAIVYKGPALAVLVYQNVAFRPFVDLDILVPRLDLERARKVLISQGYQPQYPMTAQELMFLRFQSNQQFVLPDGSGMVELHWDIMPRWFSFQANIGHLWEHVKMVDLMNRPVPTLSTQDLLLFLCVHGAKHYWERLEWICSMAELLRLDDPIDWKRVMTRARETGSLRMLFLGLALARDLLGVPLPQEVWRKVESDAAIPALARQVHERIFSESKPGSGESVRDLNKIRFHVQVRERLRDKVQYALGLMLFPTRKDWQILPLPASLFPLYYLLRPVWVAGRYLAHGVRKARTRLRL